ncbi:MAG: DNA mismatch endonuclease Vsr [Planctomycetes bacterium]|nr:DNA mismatch endonuclease Vsr [Planctomycetota bacterium]
MKAARRSELLLRCAIRSLGLRYRLTPGHVVGKPDPVFPQTQVAVFVDGDFWHERDLDRRLERLRRGHNASYWKKKLEGNVSRDRSVNSQLAAAGWLVLRFWESDVRSDAAAATKLVAAALSVTCADRRHAVALDARGLAT